MTLSVSEREELELLRASAARFMTNPVDKAFFQLEAFMDKPHSNGLDSILPTSAFHLLAKALIALKEELVK
jgi:hypothetical protein